MLALLLALQTVTPTARISHADSVALVERVKDAEFQFLMDWRHVLRRELRLYKYSKEASTRSIPENWDPKVDLRFPVGFGEIVKKDSTRFGRQWIVHAFYWSGCDFTASAERDISRHSGMAHLIKAPSRLALSMCPDWSPPNWWEPADEARSIDAPFTLDKFPPAAGDSIREMRAKVLRLVDSAARRLPGDGWLAGQRVRLHLDQLETEDARRAAAECAAAELWWCLALRAYVDYRAGDVTRASDGFDRTRAFMPDSVRCRWDDASMFFEYSGRTAYDRLTCAQRDTLNARIWWLADPLFVENGNERRTEHYARHVLVALHTALEADEHFDWREDYQGPAVEEMVIRFGWPTETWTFPERLFARIERR